MTMCRPSCLQIHEFFTSVGHKIDVRGDNYPPWEIFQTLLIKVFDISKEKTEHQNFFCTKLTRETDSVSDTRYRLFSVSLFVLLATCETQCSPFF
jgi:hypothetical protein